MPCDGHKCTHCPSGSCSSCKGIGVVGKYSFQSKDVCFTDDWIQTSDLWKSEATTLTIE